MAYLNSLSELESGIAALVSAYPSTCTAINLPNTTAQGNTVRAMRIGTPGEKTGVAFLGGLHAREWMPPEICLSFAADLLEAHDLGTGLGYGPVSYTASQIGSIFETYHLFFVPSGNPDGFDYSKAHDAVGGNGGWRRNRNPAQSGGNDSCIGVDLNRNFDVLFDFQTLLSNAANTGYISTDPCNSDQVYHGPSPMSEQETRNIAWLLDTYPEIRIFFDIHSYSELILYPWGHDQVQSSNASQNFLNPAFDGQRGVANDAYSEHILAPALSAHADLAEEIRQGIQGVNGRNYQPDISFGLYPTTGSASDYAWARHLINPALTRVYGYTIETGRSFRPAWSEAEDVIREVSSGLTRMLIAAPCALWPLTVAPPSPLEVEFADVPEGLTTYRAVVFEVTGCSATTMRIISGPTVTSGPAGTVFGTPNGMMSEVADPRPDFETADQARIWISYTGTSDGDTAQGTVRIRCDDTGQEWDVLIHANTRARPTVAVMLALDQSGSMDGAAGDLGATRVELLREAAVRFTELIPAGNAVGMIRFDHDAYPVNDPAYPGLAITPIMSDDMSDPNRNLARAAANAHATNPAGFTSIGNGVLEARSVLDPVGGYDEKAMIVFTDGIENRAAYIADVLAQIDARTFAIALGTEAQVSTSALMALAGVRDGYLLLTGHLGSGTDDYFRLTKYFHQILAGATRTDIVRDPSGHIGLGQTVKIPFHLSEADVEATAILLVDVPVIRFTLQTPAGDLIDPGVAGAAGATFATGTRMSYYRFGLPFPLKDAGAHGGTWHAVLEIDEKLWKRYFDNHDYAAVNAAQGTHPLGARYSVAVQSYSNLRMQARCDQTSLEPGASVTVHASLSEYDVPLEGRAKVLARIELPSGGTLALAMTEHLPGNFEVTMNASQAGLYRIQVEAAGTSRRGLPFTREQALTAAVYRGGDTPPTRSDSGDPGHEALCRFIRCLLNQDSILRLLKEKGIEPEALMKCLDAYCRSADAGKGETGRKAGSLSLDAKAALSDLLKDGSHDATLAEFLRDLLAKR
ncbi:M14 family zinc carboxypeptidase [Thioclava indica]|uniref:Uncharacterized protein n=1 Tax=Thioclava indica TaxID=1353528 RepID=A0A074JV56_9RHOB|nr:M14 family zinc carboxypeptidase [Thioclava indica]KEO61561.1 hypothetical protein DT23_00920 [Thioclava indica]